VSVPRDRLFATANADVSPERSLFLAGRHILLRL